MMKTPALTGVFYMPEFWEYFYICCYKISLMKTYSFEINRQNLIIRIVLVVLLFTLVFSALALVYVPKLMGPIFLVGWLGILSPLIFLKKLNRREKVTIKDKGFYVKSQDRFIGWKELSWYKLGRNSSRTVTDLIEFGVADGKKVSFPYYKKSKEENDWADFKKDILHDVKINHPRLRNYYQRKVYQLYVRYIYVIWILVPVVLILLGGTVSDIFTTTALFIGGTIPLLLAIKRNQQQKLN